MKPLNSDFGIPRLAEESGLFRARREWMQWAATGLFIAVVGVVGGCKSLNTRSQSPDKQEVADKSKIKLIGDVAQPLGMNWLRVETIGLVTNLPGTGSDPPQGPERSLLLDEMRKRGVENPSQLLASPQTELVVVQGFMRPGIQKGDRFDVEVRTLSRSEATSLAGGFFMQSDLKEMGVTRQLGDTTLREGRRLALAEGPVLVAPGATDRVELTRGRVLGGAMAVEARDLALVIDERHRDVRVSKMIGTAANRRFNMYKNGVRVDVATPKTNEYILLHVHPRYKDNVDRFVRVVQAIAMRETPAQHQERMALLENQLFEPITSAAAAIKLEAVGKESIPILKKGLKAPHLEVRFYSAEALAYLDESDAAVVLGKAAREAPAFRAYALAALSAMDDFGARETLRELLTSPSAETRYGAFRALWAMPTRDPLVEGENLGGQFGYHVLAVDGPPMIHVTRSVRPEVVLFGEGLTLSPPFLLEAGRITIHCQKSDRATLSRFAPGEPDQKRVVSTSVDEVIRTIVDMGGTYPDVVQALQKAKADGVLACRFEIEALPQGGRTFDRRRDGERAKGSSEGEAEGDSPELIPANPLPGMFVGFEESDSRPHTPKEEPMKEAKAEEKPSALGRFFGKLKKKKADD